MEILRKQGNYKEKVIVFDEFYHHNSDTYYLIVIDKSDNNKKKYIKIENPSLEIELLPATTKIRYFINKEKLINNNNNNNIKPIIYKIDYKTYKHINRFISEVYKALSEKEKENNYNIIVNNNFKSHFTLIKTIANKESFNYLRQLSNENQIIKDILDFNLEIYNDVSLFAYTIKSENYNYNIIDYKKYIFFDIEVINKIDGKFPDPEKADYPIASISYYIYDCGIETYKMLILFDEEHIINYALNIYIDDYKQFINGKLLDNEKKNNIKSELLKFKNMLYTDLLERAKKLKNMEDINIDFKLVLSEKTLLETFLKDVKEVLTLSAFNGDNFDIPYILNRAYKLGLKNLIDETFGDVYDEDGNVKNVIKKYIQKNKQYFHKFDKTKYIDFLNMIIFHQGENFLEKQSLEYVANKVLDDSYLIDDNISDEDIDNDNDEVNENNDEGIGKFKIDNITKSYLENMTDFIYYSFKDTYLLVEIERNLQSLNFIYSIKSTIPFELNNYSMGTIGDVYILTEFKDSYFIINKHKKDYYKYKIFKIYLIVNKQFGYDFPKPLIAMDTEKDFITINGKEWNIKNNNIYEYSFIKNPESYIGAFVKEPIPDIYSNVIDLDASSMYPSLIINLNISHETFKYLIPEKLALLFIFENENVINDFLSQFGDNNIIIYDFITDTFRETNINKIYELYKSKKYILSSLGIFRDNPYDENGNLISDKEGIFRKAENKPIILRKKAKKLMESFDKGTTEYIKYNGEQQVYKMIANSLYGLGGDKFSRFFNLFYACDITSSGRALITFTSYHINEYLNNTSLQ